MILTYPELLHDASEGKVLEHKRVCKRSAIARRRRGRDCRRDATRWIAVQESEMAEKLKIAKAK